MKKPLVGLLAAGLAVAGAVYLAARRGPAAAAAAEDAPLFTTRAFGAGRLLQLQAREPLRTVRWLPPMEAGWSLCQVGTQADRQLLGLFRGGELQRVFPLPRPEGLSEGFYRQAEVAEALPFQGGLLLLVKAGEARRESAFALAVDAEGALRWARPVQGERLALSGSEAWTWGPSGAQRLAPGPGEWMTWPYEVAAPSAFLPVEGGFLVGHAKGLSAWKGPEGWIHAPRPPRSPLGFAEPAAALARSGSTIYWQPEPGTLFRATSGAQVLGSETLPVPEGHPLDAGLLRLLGSDPEGRLWFDLARPALPALPAVLPPPPAESLAEEGRPSAPSPLDAGTRLALEAHLQSPLDRLHAWKPGEARLRTLAWSGIWPRLGAPPTVAPPLGEGAVRPEARAFLAGSGPDRWWFGVEALP